MPKSTLEFFKAHIDTDVQISKINELFSLSVKYIQRTITCKDTTKTLTAELSKNSLVLRLSVDFTNERDQSLLLNRLVRYMGA